MTQKQLLVCVDHSLHRRIRSVALELEMTIKDIVAQAIEQYLIPIEDELFADGKIRLVVRDQKKDVEEMEVQPVAPPAPISAVHARMIELGAPHREKMLRMLVAQGTVLEEADAEWLAGRFNNAEVQK